MAFSFLGISKEVDDLFDKKWSEAQTYLADSQMEKLLVTIKEMEVLAVAMNTTHRGKIAYLNGEYWHEKEDWDKAINFLNITVKHLQRDTSELFCLAESYLLLGSCYHEKEELDSSILNYKKSLALKQKIYDKPHLKISNIFFNIGYLYQEKEQFIKSDEAFEKGLNLLKDIYAKENVQFADFYEELGFNSFTKGNFETAIQFLQEALVLKQEEHGENHEALVYTYQYLGDAYFDNGLFGEAINYFYKALQIVEKQQKRDVFQEGILHFNIGNSYTKLNKYDKAFIYFDKALAIDKSNDFLLPAIHRIRGVEASNHKNIAVANIHFDIALEGFKQMLNKKDYLLNTYKEIAKHHASTNNMQEALVAIDRAINHGEQYYLERPVALFELYRLKGKFFRLLNDHSQALKVYSLAFKANGGTSDETLLTIKQLKNLVSLNLEYAELYHRQENKNIADLVKIDSLLSSTIFLVDYINKNYQERSTKENFIDDYHQVFSLAIKTNLNLHNLTDEEKYLEFAFKLSEKSKSLILLETIKNINAFELAGIPENIVEQEKKLRHNITYLENRRYEENQKVKIDRDIVRELNGNIFDLKQERQVLFDEIGAEYPDYYELKFKPTFTSIKEIQQKNLQPNQTILEYFFDEKVIYAFIIQKNRFQIFELPLMEEDIGQKINQFRNSIYSYRPSSVINNNSNNSLISDTNQLGFELYQTLIQPIQDHLTQRIILITDGALSYLPFDALLTARPKAHGNFKNITYLLEQYQISYAHSVNWLSGLYDEISPKFDQNFVGLAPVFKGNNADNVSEFRIGLGPLKYNQEEVYTIKNNIGGIVVTGVEATRKAFLDYIQKGQILHLATHGKSNDEQGDYSYLAFSEPQDTFDKQFLYVKDLFNLNIPADLVVLSACETGLGEMKRGEGIVGIGKGFSYAGAKSMVTTLWRVSDNSTANFMPLFYENLKKGQSKDEALWKAKKEFIQRNRSSGHPFFWAGYVAYGNMNPIKFQHRHERFSLLIRSGVLLLIIGLLTFFLRRFVLS